MTSATSPASPAPRLLSQLPNFDPRKVPVTGVDAHLPAVPATALTAEALRQRFLAPPVWQTEVDREPRFSVRDSADAAVLVALVLRDEPMVLLTERTAHLSTHSGQVAFPGGRTDDTDAQCEAAKAAWDALTDAQKELVEGEEADPDYFGRDTGDASKDDSRNQDDIGENELLVVSFGTSFNDSRVKDIKGIEDALHRLGGWQVAQVERWHGGGVQGSWHVGSVQAHLP